MQSRKPHSITNLLDQNDLDSIGRLLDSGVAINANELKQALLLALKLNEEQVTAKLLHYDLNLVVTAKLPANIQLHLYIQHANNVYKNLSDNQFNYKQLCQFIQCLNAILRLDLETIRLEYQKTQSPKLKIAISYMERALNQPFIQLPKDVINLLSQVRNDAISRFLIARNQQTQLADFHVKITKWLSILDKKIRGTNFQVHFPLIGFVNGEPAHIKLIKIPLQNYQQNKANAFSAFFEIFNILSSIKNNIDRHVETAYFYQNQLASSKAIKFNSEIVNFTQEFAPSTVPIDIPVIETTVAGSPFTTFRVNILKSHIPSSEANMQSPTLGQ